MYFSTETSTAFTKSTNMTLGLSGLEEKEFPPCSKGQNIEVFKAHITVKLYLYKAP